MRLQQYERECIIALANTIFGQGSKVILFGSRVYDHLKGGDIDLYIQPAQQEDLSQKKIDFLVALKTKIGDQKIDLVLAKDKLRLIEQEALNKGVELA